MHLYERWTNDDEKFIEFFKSGTKIQGWEIAREGIPRVVGLTKKVKVTHVFVLKGYYGLKDSAASDIAFNAIVDAVILKFISKKVPGSEGNPLARAEKIEARMFGKYLCHHARIELEVAEIWTPVSDEELAELVKVGLNYYLAEPDGRIHDTADAADEITLIDG